MPAQGRVSRLRLYLRLGRLMAVIGLGLGLATCVAILERLSRGDLLPLRQRLTRWFMRRLSHALPVRIRVSGELPTQPMLWVSNHVSWIDIPLLGMLAPQSFLSKAEVRDWPVAGWLAEKAGTLFIRRGSGDSHQLKHRLAEHLHQRRHLLIFPEGTTTDGRELRGFHGRLLASASEAGVAIQPVAIAYRRDGEIDDMAPFIGDDDLPAHLLRLLSSEAAEVHIQLLPPLATQAVPASQLARQAHERIRLALFGTSDEQASARQAA